MKNCEVGQTAVERAVELVRDLETMPPPIKKDKGLYICQLCNQRDVDAPDGIYHLVQDCRSHRSTQTGKREMTPIQRAIEFLQTIIDLGPVIEGLMVEELKKLT